jgi:putative MFS transporter
VAVAALYGVFAPTSLSWRGLYLVGVLPLLLVGILRFKLRETVRFRELRSEGGVPERVPFREVLGGPYRRQALLISAVYFLTHVGMIAGIYWFTFFAQRERGFTPADVSTFLVTAYPLGMLGYFAAGWLQDRIGRRITGSFFMVAGMALGISMFQVSGKPAMFLFLVLSVFFGLGITPILGALAPELFPTEIRATAVALARSVFGTLGATIGPFVAGQLADPGHGLVGNIGDSVSVVLLAYLPAALLLWRLPETRGRDLAHVQAPGSAEELVAGGSEGGGAGP